MHTHYILASRQASTRRQRGTIGVLSVVLALMVVLTGTTLVFYGQANYQRDQANNNEHTAKINALSAYALSNSLGANLDERLLLSLLAVHMSGKDPLYGAHNSLLTLLQGNHDVVGYLHTPNARVGDGSIRLAESGDGNTLLSYSGAGLFAWDMSQPTIMPRALPLPRHYEFPEDTLLAISADGQYAAVAGTNSLTNAEAELSIVSVATGKTVAKYPGFVPEAIALSADGKEVAASSTSATGQTIVAVWGIGGDPQHPNAKITATHAVTRLAFNNTGGLLAVGKDFGTPADPSTSVWNLTSGKVSAVATIDLVESANDSYPQEGLAFSTDGNWLVVSGSSSEGGYGETAIFKVASNRFTLAATLPEQGEITAPRDGDFFLASCTDNLVCTQITIKGIQLDPFSTNFVQTLDGVGILAHIAFLAGVNKLAISTDNGSILLWQNPFEDFGDSTELPGIQNPPSFFSPNGQIVAHFHDDGTLGLWNARSLKLLTDTPQTRGILSGGPTLLTVGVSNDGAEVAALNDSGQILVHRRTRVTRLADLPPILANPLEASALLQLSMDWTGQHVAALTCVGPQGSCATTEVDIWDTTSGKRIAQRTFASGGSIAFTPDGRTLAVGQPNAVTFYNFAKDTVTRPFGVGDVGLVAALAFDPRGKTIAALSQHTAFSGPAFGLNQYLLQWDVGTGNALGLPQPLELGVTSVSIDAQGNLYSLAGPSIYRLNYSLAGLTKSACAIANRSLTRSEWQQFADGEPYVKLCTDLP